MASMASCSRPGAFSQAAIRRAPCVSRARLVISASFRNKENIDMSKVAGYKQADNDTGSTQVQIARLSARVEQISKHLIANKKDNSSKRGLELVLAERKSLLQYLYRKDRNAYDKICADLGIRNVVASDLRTKEERAAAAAGQ